MNTRVFSLLLASLFFAGFALAQTDAPAAANGPIHTVPAATASRPQPQGGVTRSSASLPAGPRGRGAQPAAKLGPPLKDNVTLSLKGTYALGLPVDFSVTGAGPQLIKESEVSSPSVTGGRMSFKGTISDTTDGYWLDFTLGMQVPLAAQLTHNTQTNTTTSSVVVPNTARQPVVFHTIAFSSSLRLKSGQPVTVLDDGGRTLILTVTKADAP